MVVGAFHEPDLGLDAVSGATSASYQTVDADANYYLRATASYDDGAGAGKSASAVSANPVRAPRPATYQSIVPVGDEHPHRR